jgi:ribosomal protein S18 acetylase RimI-like enzyme
MAILSTVVAADGNPTDIDLYRIGCRTLVHSWQAYARGIEGAAVLHRHGFSAAVFPTEPERSVYNNALLRRGLGPDERAEALDAMEHVYAEAGVGRFAAWAHETDPGMCTDLEGRGYSLDTTTRAMGMSLNDVRLPHPDADLGPAEWPEYLAAAGLPAGFLRAADHTALHVLVARADNAIVAAALAYDWDGDCGIYNVETLPVARRRGVGTRLTLAHLHHARARGCRTASLQSTPMAERMYASVGFRDLGRFLEYVPEES